MPVTQKLKIVVVVVVVVAIAAEAEEFVSMLCWTDNIIYVVQHLYDRLSCKMCSEWVCRDWWLSCLMFTDTVPRAVPVKAAAEHRSSNHDMIIIVACKFTLWN